jgi:membrane-bound lytic murein transglycosylase
MSKPDDAPARRIELFTGAGPAAGMDVGSLKRSPSFWIFSNF